MTTLTIHYLILAKHNTKKKFDYSTDDEKILDIRVHKNKVRNHLSKGF